MGIAEFKDYILDNLPYGCEAIEDGTDVYIMDQDGEILGIMEEN